MSIAACERGFLLMNRIKSKGRSGLTNLVTNRLMCICSNGDNLESFDPQSAVTEWSRNVQCRPGVRRNKATSTSTRIIDIEAVYDYETDSDSNNQTESNDSDFCNDLSD